LQLFSTFCHPPADWKASRPAFYLRFFWARLTQGSLLKAASFAIPDEAVAGTDASSRLNESDFDT
jgi:hypothetical protein